jgi:hypothetical protein
MIWPTLALTALLTPGQDAPLALKNARVTQGVLGPARADTRFLPVRRRWPCTTRRAPT